MSVPVVNIRIEKSVDFEKVFTVKNPDESLFNLNGYTATSKIRKHPTSTGVTTFTAGITTSTSQITLSLTETQTASLKSGINVYDIIITKTSTSKTSKVFEGNATVVDTSSR